MGATTMLLLNTIEGDVRAAPSLKRADLLRLPEPPNLSPIRLQVHRNYAFELVGSVLAPFLWLSGLKSSIAYSDYDDSLSFAQIDPVAIQLISLDFERYGETAGSASFRDWFAGRLKSLRDMTERTDHRFQLGLGGARSRRVQSRAGKDCRRAAFGVCLGYR